MKKILKYVAAVALLFLGLGAFAQEKTQAYYNTHESEILPDAQVAFREGDYDRTVELCRLHFIIVGDNRADALRDKARECAKLTIEMNAFASADQRDLAREKAQAILALNSDDKKAQELSKYDSSKGGINGHEWVDLGLPSGLKWATCNVGASSPERYGSYFAWGETSTKREYSWENYTFRLDGNGYVNKKRQYVNNVTFSKYNTDPSHGSVDNRTRLELSDDAASVNWGSSWRVPTDQEWMELRKECTWTRTKQGGTEGYLVKSKKNGNSIFLPAAGYRRQENLSETGIRGEYWTASLITGNPYNAWFVMLYSSSVNSKITYGGFRCDGLSVRPVSE